MSKPFAKSPGTVNPTVCPMPVRFHCVHCHQRLSVSSRMRGEEVKCPRCRRVTRVPRRPGEEPSGGGSDVEEKGSLPETSFPDVVASDIAAPPEGREEEAGERPSPTAPLAAATMLADRGIQSTGNRVAVPRYVLYTQGFLLGAVALVFFVFGLVVGTGARDGQGAQGGAGPVAVAGSVAYVGPSGSPAPDAQSVVILLPDSRRPDQKMSVAGLRPEDEPAGADHPALAMLRGVGGDYARVDRRGRYRVRGATPGRYALVIISFHRDRTQEDSPRPHHLARLGRFFLPAHELLAGKAYRWKELLLREDQQVSVTFERSADGAPP